MSEYERDESLIHLDGLRTLADRAAIASGPDEEGPLDYERLGVCTPDLVAMAGYYGQSIVQKCGERGMSGDAMLVYQFLAGFDIGYQAALEHESRVSNDTDDMPVLEPTPNPTEDDPEN